MMMTSLRAVTAVILILSSSISFAAAPQSIHYQGYLTDDLGEPVNDTVEMEFRLYDVEVAGEAFWSTDGPMAVDIENGVFRVTLALVTAAELAAGHVWLGITVVPSDPGEPSQEMLPRLKVQSVPYALVAEHATSSDFAGEAAAVTDIDFTTFATGEDVEGVLGVCIQEVDLTEALAGYCEAPCYGDANVEGLLVDGGYVTEVYLTDNSYLTGSDLDSALEGVCQAPCYGEADVEWLLNEGGYVTEIFLTENGYVTLEALAQWVEENNIGGGLDEAALAAYLSAGGYLTEAELLWFLAEAGFIKIEDLAGLGYVPGPHYSDADVELVLATKDYCQGPCFSGSYTDLSDKPELNGHDADTVDGYDTNATGTPVAQTIPITDETGKIPQELLPFNKGDLLAPADRQLVEGLEGYETSYFGIEDLGIDGNVAANVKEGVIFGPGDALTGSMVPPQLHDDFAWWTNPDKYIVYDDFIAGELDPLRWDTWLSYSANVEIVDSNQAGGTSPELRVYCPGDGTWDSSVGIVSSLLLPANRHIYLKFYIGGVWDGYGSVTLGSQSKSHKGCHQCPTSHSGILMIPAQESPPSLSIKCEEHGYGGWAYVDDIRISRYKPSDKSWLNCDDLNVCTLDYYGGETADACAHVPNSNNCDDDDACTLDDICSAGTCSGVPKDCGDETPYTTDDCDPDVGCVNETCPIDVSEFDDGDNGWQLGADWVWDESGWLQGFGSTGALVSHQFSQTSAMLKVRYKCLGEGGLVFEPGPNVPCQYDGVWVEDFVDLGGATWLVQMTHYGAGSVLIDIVEALEPCE